MRWEEADRGGLKVVRCWCWNLNVYLKVKGVDEIFVFGNQEEPPGWLLFFTLNPQSSGK